MGLEYTVDVATADGFNKALRELETASQDTARAINKQLGGEVTKKIVLETVVKDGRRQLKAVEKEYLTVVDNIRKEQRKVGSIDINSVTSLRQQVNKAKKDRDELARFVDTANGIGIANPKWEELNNKVRSLGGELRKVDGSGFWDRLKGDLGVGQVLSFANGLSQIVNGFQAVSIVVGQVIGSVNALTDALAKLQSFGLAFQAIGAGASGSQQALSESSRIALNLGVGLQTVRDGFQQLSPVILNSGGTLSDVSGIMEALSSRFAAFGISGDRARRVTNGIIQAFGKGKLQAEELTQQIAEADPAFGTDLARALGVSTAELLRMVKAGELTSDVLIRVLPTLSKSALLYGQLGQSAGDAVDALTRSGTDTTTTFDQVRNKIASLNQLSFEELARSLKPFLIALLDVQATVSDFFSRLSKSSALDALGSALGVVVDILNTTVQVFLNAASGFLTIIDPIARVIDWLLKVPLVSQAIGVAIIANLVAPLTALQASFLKTLNSGRTMLQGLTGLAGGISGVGGKVGATGAAIGGLGEKMKGVTATSNAAVGAYAKQATSLSTLAKASASAGAAAAQQKAKLDSLMSAKAATGGQGGALSAGIDKGIADAEKKYARFTATQERAVDKIKKVNAEIGASGKTLQSQGQSVAGAGAQYSRLTKTLGSLQGVNAQAVAGLGKANAELRVLKTNGIAAAGGFNAYTQQQLALNSKIQQFGAIQESTGQRIAATKEKLSGLTVAAGKSTGAFGKVNGAFGASAKALMATGGAVKGVFGGLAAALGPVGIAMAAVGVVQAAYTAGMAKANEITEKAAISAKAFEEILKRLGNTEVKVPEPKGFDLLWKSFSANAANEINEAGSVIDAFVAATQGDFSKLQKVDLGAPFKRMAGNLQSLGNLNAFQAITQQSVDARAQLDATAAGVKDLRKALDELKKAQASGPKPGETADGKESRVLKGFNDVQEQSSLLAQGLKELEERQAAINKKYVEGGSASAYLRGKMAEIDVEIKKQRKELTAAQKALLDFGNAIGALSDDKLLGLVSSFDALDAAAKKFNDELNSAAPDSKDFAKFAASSAATGAAIERLKKKAEDPIVLRIGLDEALLSNAAKEADALARLAKAQKEGDVQAIASVRKELAELARDKKNLKAFKIELDASSINNAQKAIKALEDEAIKVDVNAPELAGLIKNLQTAKQVLENREFTKNSISIGIIAQGLDDGSLVANADRLQELIGLIDGQLAKVSIDSPSLPGLIGKLEKLKEEVTALDGRKATVTVTVIEKGLKDGSIGRNQGSLDRRAQAQQTVVNSTNSNAPNYDAELQKLKRFEEEKKVISMSTFELTNRLAINSAARSTESADKQVNDGKKVFDAFSAGLEKRKQASTSYYSNLKTQVETSAAREIASIDRVAAAVDAAYQRRANAIQREIAAMNKRYDAEIAKLQELTPAEQALEDKRIKALEAKARGSGDGALEAKAELERMERQKQINKLEQERQVAQEQAQEKLAAVETQRQQAAIVYAEQKAKVEEEARKKIAALEEEERQKQAAFEEELRAAKERLILLEAEAERAKEEQQKAQLEAEKKNRSEEDAALNKELEARGKIATTTAESSKSVKDVMLPALEAAVGPAEAVSESMQAASGAVAKTLLPSMTKSAQQAASIVSQLNSLNGRVITLTVKQVQGRWTGGPVSGGESYTVNELGREGFMSSSGAVREINKAPNSTWRAPSSGYVIPAHIWAGLDVPKAGVKVNQPVSRVTGRGSEAKILGALKAALGGGDNGVRESVERLSEIQTRQATKIGRLSHAISKLADKDWNVSVHVPPIGPPGRPGPRRRGLG
jgi:tape measure domain-containing protein